MKPNISHQNVHDLASTVGDQLYMEGEQSGCTIPYLISRDPISRLMHVLSCRFLILFIMVAGCNGSSHACAQTSFWSNGLGGLYSSPGNWTNFQVPPDGGNAYFTLSAAYTVEIDVNASTTNTIFAANNSTIHLDISASSYTVTQMKVGTGAGTSNQVLVSGGLLDAGVIEIAPSLGAGNLIVTSALQSNYLVVGGQVAFPGFVSMTPGGQGTLTIESGGSVTVKGLLADKGGAGSRVVLNGGQLSIQGIGRFNSDLTPQSFTTVGDGNQSALLNLENDVLPNGDIIPGQFDFGMETLTINPRAVVNFNSPGGSLKVGDIEPVNSQFFPSGVFQWEAGRINLTNSGFRIGNNGQFGNSVELSELRQISTPLDTEIGAGASLTLDGGSLETSTLNNSGGSFMFHRGSLAITNGNLVIGSGGITNSGGITIDPSGIILTSGSMTIDSGRSVNVAGGVLVVDRVEGSGQLNFESGVLEIVSGNISAGASGQLNSNSDIQIGTGSSIRLQNGDFTLLADRNIVLAGGQLSARHLSSQGSITVESGYLFATRIFHNGLGSAAQFLVADSAGDGGNSSTVYSFGMERNNMIVNGGLIQIESDGQTFDPILDGSLVGGYTSDSSLVMNNGTVIAPTVRIGVTEGFVDTVTINGGSLITDNLLSNGGARSVLNFNGGTISTGHSDIDGPAAFTIGNGITDALLNLTGGGTHTFADGIVLSTSGRIGGEGTIIADLLNRGQISPGNSPGVLEVDGDLVNLGEIKLEIESASTFDSLVITGTFEAGGIISLSLLGYDPGLSDSFDLVDFGNFLDVGYVFDLSNATLGPGLAWDTTRFSIDGSLSVSAVPEPSAMVVCLCALTIVVARRRPSSSQGATKTS